MNLDFVESSGFARRSRPVPGLADAVRKSLCDSPPLQGLLAWQCGFKGDDFGVILERFGQRIRLLCIFELPAEELQFSRKLGELRARGRAKEAS